MCFFLWREIDTKRQSSDDSDRQAGIEAEIEAETEGWEEKEKKSDTTKQISDGLSFMTMAMASATRSW